MHFLCILIRGVVYLNMLFRNKYRIPSARWVGWDYRNPGGYFVTICTHKRRCYFGSISRGQMHLNALGVFARHCWEQIPEHISGLQLHEFTVMPNHIHGIIVLQDINPEPAERSYQKEDGTLKNQFMTDISPGKHSLAVSIRSFKSAVTRWAGEQGIPFAWQARYHDHVIRNEEEWNAIARYIVHNPRNWKEDRFYHP